MSWRANLKSKKRFWEELFYYIAYDISSRGSVDLFFGCHSLLPFVQMFERRKKRTIILLDFAFLMSAI